MTSRNEPEPPEFLCWLCGRSVDSKYKWANLWVCEPCDVGGSRQDLVTAAFKADTFRFAGHDRTFDEEYIDHSLVHVPCP